MNSAKSATTISLLVGISTVFRLSRVNGRRVAVNSSCQITLEVITTGLKKSQTRPKKFPKNVHYGRVSVFKETKSRIIKRARMLLDMLAAREKEHE